MWFLFWSTSRERSISASRKPGETISAQVPPVTGPSSEESYWVGPPILSLDSLDGSKDDTYTQMPSDAKKALDS